MIQERIVQYPNRRRVTKVIDPTNTSDSFLADIIVEGEGTVTQTGTLITVETLRDFIYPVGSIYMSVNPTNPQTLFGGSWVTWGQGRVPLGIGNNGETNYITSDQTGGSENSVATHTHTINQSSSGSGTTSATITSSSNSATKSLTGSFQVFSFSGTTEPSGIFTGKDNTSSRPAGSGNGRTVVSLDATHEHTTLNHTHTISNANAGTAGGNRMPFVTCYMWKRTA